MKQTHFPVSFYQLPQATTHPHWLRLLTALDCLLCFEAKTQKVIKRVATSIQPCIFLLCNKEDCVCKFVSIVLGVVDVQSVSNPV